MNAPSLLTWFVARRERAVEHVEGAAEEDDDAADEPELGREERRADGP
jgi:hypothetical protein